MQKGYQKCCCGEVPAVRGPNHGILCPDAKTGGKAQPDRRLLYFHAREWEHKRKRGTHGQGNPGMKTGKILG